MVEAVCTLYVETMDAIDLFHVLFEVGVMWKCHVCIPAWDLSTDF